LLTFGGVLPCKKVIFFSVKDFEQLQHYTDRNPPWLKLHISLLEDYKFYQLNEKEQLCLLKLWILATKMNNKVPYDHAYVGNQILMDDPPLESLAERGYLFPFDKEWSNPCSSRSVSKQVKDIEKKIQKHVC
jgi:hypothetical protein